MVSSCPGQLISKDRILQPSTVSNGLVELTPSLNGIALAFKFPRKYVIDDDGFSHRPRLYWPVLR